MTFGNESTVDRFIRLFAGFFFLYAGWSGFATGVFGIGLMIVGVVVLATALSGYCPAYSVFGLSTRH